MAVVNLDALQVIFAEKTAVSAASFSVEAGETFSLIGASGCGKSTILRVLAGLQREWRGGVQLFGKAMPPAFVFRASCAATCRCVSGSLCLSAPQPYAVAYPGRTAENPRSRRLRQRVDTALEQVGLPADAARRFRISFPAASASAWPLRARCCCARRSCC